MLTPDIYQRTMVDVLTPELKRLVKDYFTLYQFQMTGCTREDGFAGQGVIPLVEMEQHTVFEAATELGTYNHHPNLVKWRDEYWFAWDNCLVNEEWPGQRTFIAHSPDGVRWSERALVADGDAERGMLRNLGGLYPRGDTLYAFIQEKWDLAHATAPGMSAHDNAQVSVRNDLWATQDGTNWELIKQGYVDVQWMFENPRLTAAGRLMGPMSDHDGSPGVVLWPGDNPEQTPQIIHQPWHADRDNYYAGHDVGIFGYGEATWYTDDDGRIWMYCRDESASMYLGLTLSEDGGQTWTEIMGTNFPDSGSRTFAGRLSDGRFYQVGNSTRVHMDRNFFALSLSDDGARFNRMVQLVREPTYQRFQGHLKCHGHQYPSCVVDGDRLLIGHSINKEDIAVGIVDTTAV